MSTNRDMTLSHRHRQRLPTSPPAPHRRAPLPPTYSPRRPRPRHIRMNAPERNGLFTLSETDEDEPAFTFNLPSANASSEILSPSPDVPCDVDMDEDMMDGHRLSWSTTGSRSSEPATPNLEEEDPFSLEYTWRGMPEEECEPVHASRYQPRRPPPLDETKNFHPYSATSIAHTEDVTTPRSAQTSLLPALPITRTKRRPATPISSAEVNLISALENLISTCGESDPYPSASSFPLPPPRTPTTPSPKARLLLPPPVIHPQRDETWRPTIRGDHSYLNSMSRECDSPPSSLGSSSSKRSLPGRKGLPGEWMRFGNEM